MKIRMSLLIIMVSLTSASIIVTVVLATQNFVNRIRSEVVENLNVVSLNLLDKLSRQMFENVATIHSLSIGNILGNSNLTLAEKNGLSSYNRKSVQILRIYINL